MLVKINQVRVDNGVKDDTLLTKANILFAIFHSETHLHQRT